MIKGILFDVHGTILDKGGKKALKGALKNVVAFLNKNGYRVTFDEYYQIWLQNIRKHRKDLEELNEVSFYDWYEGILSNLGLEDYNKEFMDRLNNHFMEGFRDTTKEMPNTKLVLTRLKKSFLLGIVSNSLEQNTRIDLATTGLIDFFDGIFVSSEIGKRKPHPLIFKKALEGLSIGPEEAVFVGDDLFEDVLGAGQLGMKTVFLTKGDSLKDFNEKEVFRKILNDKGLTKEDIRPERIEKADFVIGDLKGLLELAKQWGKK
jgi:putative hydrolase of the HAD superfamily